MSELHGNYGAHGIIFAYSASPDMGELVRQRTLSSLPFGGRYRLIDFSLSSMMNAGIRDVGVIMQRDYQSLLDHLGSGKSWDMSRKSGGLRILPPFGLPEYHKGNYTGTIEALTAVSTYIRSVKQENIVLFLGNLCANVDLSAALDAHIRSGRGVTAICSDRNPADTHYRFVADESGTVTKAVFSGDGEGVASLECYVIRKDVLVEMIDRCRAENLYRFHKDALAGYLAAGGTMGVYVHRGYVSLCRTISSYYEANMALLDSANRRDLFPADRPVRTRSVEGVSTYYGEEAFSRNSLVADNCIIDGSIENCIVFSGARISKGAKLTNCIIMRGCTVGAGAELNHVIADKFSAFGDGITLIGSPNLPIVVPKNSVI